MRISLFGVFQSFGINRIGGTDSLFRRLARQWVAKGENVTFVNYRCPSRESFVGWHGIAVEHFIGFRDALDWLGEGADFIVVNTLHRNDRLHFARFRRRFRSQKRFFIVYTLYRERLLPRHFYFLESILFPYRNGTFCVSPRLTRALGFWVKNATLVWPPVGTEFFCPPERKPASDRIRVTYVGRTQKGKGIHTVLEILERLRGEAQFALQVFGYHFPDDTEAEDFSLWLQAQDWLDYEHRDIHTWSPNLDLVLAQRLADTDILLLPYDRLSSSIDTPLLLTEGMAASCCVLTKPLGDIPQVYGSSPLLIGGPDFARKAVELIRAAPSWLAVERERVYRQACSLKFDEVAVAERALSLIVRG